MAYFKLWLLIPGSCMSAKAQRITLHQKGKYCFTDIDKRLLAFFDLMWMAGCVATWGENGTRMHVGY